MSTATEMPAVVTAGPTILVVDDSPADRRLASTLLETGLAARIQPAANSRDALKAIRREQPSVVLTNLMTNGTDGIELIEIVRENYPAIPVVVMTAEGGEGIALRAMQAGAASFVSKREIRDQLTITIENVLANVRQQRRRGRVLECAKRLDCDYELENDPALVPHFIAHLQEQMVRMRLCDERTKSRLGVALEEALLNGIYHGNLELSSHLRQDGGNQFETLAEVRRQQSPYCERRLHVEVRISPREAHIVVRDEGHGFDVSALPDPTAEENLLKASGRGLLLIRTFMDEVYHNSSGNQITMIKRQ